MGSIASENVRILDQETLSALHIPERVVDWVTFRETQELQHRERVFAHDRKMPGLAGKVVILVDEGVTSSSRMPAAIQAIRRQGARRIVVAVPVGAKQSTDRLRSLADQVVCLIEPQVFFSVGHWYENFEPVEDWEVCQILESLTESTPTLQMA